MLMIGPPGCGKSLLAETFPTILPRLSDEAQLEVLSLYQLAGETKNDSSPPLSPCGSCALEAIRAVWGGNHQRSCAH
ncbi:magnesium chelatase family protein [Anoxybacillus tengchongensis]|uniref:Magnesium chelatase family protein n=1 Tax=Anoxybacillus tengchongensis TaxID=576944 RepID=A0A7X0D927_9BACL|nr:magnesium chelatase family protein [Anoxybacillus tengchongensis]